MKVRKLLLVSFCIVLAHISFAENGPRLSASLSSNNELVVVINKSLHLRYGCTYPMTYQLSIPHGIGGLSGQRKYQSNDIWGSLQEKTAQDFFNAVEAVRFDYGSDKAYVSAAFSSTTDSLFIQISDSQATPVAIRFDGICRYYDNRVAAVTVSADDYSDWVASSAASSGFDFNRLLGIFRSYNLFVTVGVITDPQYTTHGSWTLLQKQLDSGFVEVASHSRNHLPTPYDSSAFAGYTSAAGEVLGSIQDIKTNLSLPPLFSMNGSKYIYTWIAPYGDYDSTVDSLAGVAGYLTARLYANLPIAGPRAYVYGDSTLADWDSHRNHFKAFLPSVEIGAPSWGGGDTSVISLNGLFDSIAAKGDVYHFMWHPQVVAPDANKSYFQTHLTYVSNRKNIWYANLGHIYLYHFLQMTDVPIGTASIAETKDAASSFQLYQNFPNPFNPATTIRYAIPHRANVTLSVYNILGQEVATLVNRVMEAGNYEVKFDGTGLASGVYVYRIQAGSFVKAQKLIFLQ